MTSRVVTTICLEVGRTFKTMLINVDLIDFIEINIPKDIFDYQFDELIHTLEDYYRLDFFDESTNGWYTIPRNKGFRHLEAGYQARKKSKRKRQKIDPTPDSNDSTNKSNKVELVNQEICESNILKRLRASKKFRIDVQRTFNNPVPIIPTNYNRYMKRVTDANDIEKATLYQKRM